ncbi:LRRN4 C-terminal-like protein [Gasterosteus aculeatus]
MTSPCKNLGVLLLFLSASPLFHPHLFTHAASTNSTPGPLPRIIYMTDFSSDDNYDDDNDNNSPPPPIVPDSAKTTNRKPQLCHYSPCLENQEPCGQISARNGCLCPGVSGADEPPHAPRIQALQAIREGRDRGKIEVQWCAPSSVVSVYRVGIEGREVLEFQDVSRRGLVGSLEVGTKVCVEAVNRAGSSTPSDFSCMRYYLPESSDYKVLAGVIGGGVAILVLLIIGAVLLWKHQMRKRAERDSADGLGNPSYSKEGTL